MTEVGFYHPDRGYWQATGEPPQEVLDSYPEGTQRVPLKPGADYEWIDGAWVYNPPTPSKSDLAAYAATQRWQNEVGGTVWNGWPVPTDRDSQSKIMAERLAILEGERTDPDGWKFADGEFRMVSNSDFLALSNAVRDHVRAYFALEATVLAQIEAEAITTFAEIDAAFA